jgi:hypothetical protein
MTTCGRRASGDAGSVTDGPALGAIVLHTVALREFDGRILNVLSRDASLVAWAIENAGLYEKREVAGVSDRSMHFELASGRSLAETARRRMKRRRARRPADR